MLSILIPVYNYDCSELVKALQLQGERLKQAKGEEYEIIVGDDASSKGRGIESVQKCINELKETGVDVPELARDLMKTYDKNIKALRLYL